MTLTIDQVYKTFESNRRTDYRLTLLLDKIFLQNQQKLRTCEMNTCKKTILV